VRGQGSIILWGPAVRRERDTVHGAATAANPGMDFNASRMRLGAKVSKRIEVGLDARRPGQNARLPMGPVRGGPDHIHITKHLDNDGIIVAAGEGRNQRVHLTRAAHAVMKDIHPRRPKFLRGGCGRAQGEKQQCKQQASPQHTPAPERGCSNGKACGLAIAECIHRASDSQISQYTAPF